MCATYHVSWAEEVNIEILNAKKSTFKSKPTTIVVAETTMDESHTGARVKGSRSLLLS